MSEEGDFLREFEDEESDAPGGGFGRQQSKMSEALSHKASFDPYNNGIGGNITPQSSHMNLNKQESHLSATTQEFRRSNSKPGDQQNAFEDQAFPVSLADLQDGGDDDKSSLESGQVSPEAFDEREEPGFQAPQQPNQRGGFNNNQGGNQGARKDRNPADNKRMPQRNRGRRDRSRSQSPSNYQDGPGGQGGNNWQQQQPYGGGFQGGRGGHNNHGGHQGGNNYQGNNHFNNHRGGGEGHGRGGYQGGYQQNNNFGGNNSFQGGNRGGRGGNNYNNQHQNSFNSQQSMNSSGGHGGNFNNNSNNNNNNNSANNAQTQQQKTALNTQLEQLMTYRTQQNNVLTQLQTAGNTLQSQMNLMPADQNLKSQHTQMTEKINQQAYMINYCNQQIQMVYTQQQQLQQQSQQSNQNQNQNEGGNDRGGRGGYGGRGRGDHHRGGRGGNSRGGFNEQSHFGENNYGGGRGRGFGGRGRGGDHMDGGHGGGRGFHQRGGRGRGDQMGGYGGRGRGGHDNHHGGFNNNGPQNNHRGGHHGGNNHHQNNNSWQNQDGPGGHHNNNQLGLHHQNSNMSNMSGSMGTPRGPPGIKQQQSASVINARRYSIYIKNVPQDKFNNVEIDTFFQNFGDVVRIDRHPEKQAATVKFKDIESAEKAAFFAIQQRQPLWNDPNVQLIYNCQGMNPRSGSMSAPASRVPMMKHHSMPQPNLAPPVPQMTEEEKQQKAKLDAVKKQIAAKRQLLLQKITAEIQKGLEQLLQPGITPEQVTQIEAQIESQKAKIRLIKSHEEKDKLAKQQQVQQARAKYQQAKTAVPAEIPQQPACKYPVEMKLVNIQPHLRQFSSILECLKAHSQVSDFRFTEEDKSTAFVKFMAPEANSEAFLTGMVARLQSQGPPLPFEPSLVKAAPANPAADVN